MQPQQQRRSKAKILEEQKIDARHSIDAAVAVYNALVYGEPAVDEDEDTGWKKAASSVGEDGKIVDPNEVKSLALQVMKKGLKKLLED